MYTVGSDVNYQGSEFSSFNCLTSLISPSSSVIWGDNNLLIRWLQILNTVMHVSSLAQCLAHNTTAINNNNNGNYQNMKMYKWQSLCEKSMCYIKV